jgi:hypothetical protein
MNLDTVVPPPPLVMAQTGLCDSHGPAPVARTVRRAPIEG